jgi:hypothetical protein
VTAAPENGRPYLEELLLESITALALFLESLLELSHLGILWALLRQVLADITFVLVKEPLKASGGTSIAGPLAAWPSC